MPPRRCRLQALAVAHFAREDDAATGLRIAGFR
jgi:hypothetical protein